VRTIAIFNQKGGVGKTITAATMAHILATKHNKRVLLADCDGQGNLTQYFGVDPEDLTTTLSILWGEHEACYTDYLTQVSERIHILPADSRLLLADLKAITGDKENAPLYDPLLQLADLRDVVAEDDAYDFFILDCPTGFSTSAAAALIAADDIIIPIRMGDSFSTSGMSVLLMIAAQMRNYNPRLKVAGILPTHYEKTPEHAEIIRILREEYGLPVFKSAIYNSKAVSESTFSDKQLVDFSPKAWASHAYKRFVREYLERTTGGVVNG
jgi:chromosome partitioning protein